MKISPLAIGFGAVIENIDLKNLDVGVVEALQDAVLEYGLLVIRDQSLTPQQQVGVSGLFGVLETFHGPASRDALPQIFRVASRIDDGHVDVGRYWHSDGSFRVVPTAMSIWYSVAQPEVGGETLFTDQQRAYETLSEATQLEIRDLVTFHRNGVAHPLVMPHPKTGVKGIYLNVGLTSDIEGLSATDAGMLIEHLNMHLSRPGAVYAHQWLPGDFVLSDSFRVAHQATATPSKYRRVLDRTTIRGGSAFWDQDQDLMTA